MARTTALTGPFWISAYDLYLRAKALWDGWSTRTPAAETLRQAASVLDQAIARDPEFFLAYCHLACVHDDLYFNGGDRSPARLALAETAIATARRLRPNSGKIHLLQAEHLYRCYLEYDQARAELAIAQRLLPNDAQIFALMASIDRRQEQVAATLQIPSLLNYGKLRLHPFWDPVRGDPRFEKIVAALAPDPRNGR